MAKQPPPILQRKPKLEAHLKNVLTEQKSKLQQKQQLEHELLEDIKNYSKARAAIERDYGLALQRMAAQFSVKFLPKENDNSETKTLARTPFGLWRKVLEETDKTANARIAMSQSILTNVTENAKTLKAARIVTTKNCNTLADKLQEELLESVQELSKSHKTYSDLHKLAIQTKDQAEDADEKLKKGQLKFFQSKAKAEKNAQKIKERRDICEKRVTVTRNEYILDLAAVNAHFQRYYSMDLPELIALQDGNVYEKFKDYFKTLTTLEVETCARSESVMQQLREEAAQLQRAHAMQLFLRLNPVFTKCLNYEFQSSQGDKVKALSQDHSAAHHLNKEARKWTVRLAKAQRTIRNKSSALQALERSNVDSDKTSQAEGIPVEQSKDAIMEDIRHSEIVKIKAEARLDILREAGVNVDEWLQSASAENGEEEENYNDQEEDYQSDFDDDIDDWGDEEDDLEEAEFSDDHSSSSTQSHKIVNAIALYSFQAASREELSITENEELEIIETDVDGWCKGRNKSGLCGYLPEAYVKIIKQETRNRTTNSVGSGSTSSGQKPPVAPKPSFERASSQNEPTALFLAKALYDYTAVEEEELSFKDGDIIKVTSMDNNGVDDGWWEGYFNGKRGVFPSIVVERIEDSKPKNENLSYDRRRLHTDTFAAKPKVKRKVERTISES